MNTISAGIPFTAHSFDTSFHLRVSNELFLTSIRSWCKMMERVGGCNLLPLVSEEREKRDREPSVLSLAALPSSDNSFHSIRTLSADGTPDMLVHSRTTHVHVCVIPGIDRSLLDRSGAGSMLFLPFARAILPFIFCSLRLRRY